MTQNLQTMGKASGVDNFLLLNYTLICSFEYLF